MTQDQSETMRENLMTATVARKRLVEVAAWLDRHSEINGNDPYLTTHCLSVYIREAVEKLDFALDQFDSFMREAGGNPPIETSTAHARVHRRQSC